MVHGHCAKENTSAFFTKEYCGKKGFPKQFREENRTDDDVGSQYSVNLNRTSRGYSGEKDVRRTLIHEGTSSFHNDIPVDNSWVVSYNPHLLRIFACHINAYIRLSRFGEIKYVFQYGGKVHDLLTIHLKESKDHAYEKVQNYQYCR